VTKRESTCPQGDSPVTILDIEEEEKCFLSQVYESWLWNRMLEHLIFDKLIKANEKEEGRDLPKVIKLSDPICKHFQIGKKTRVRLKKRSIPQLNH
jgi:hypothetical protein